MYIPTLEEMWGSLSNIWEFEWSPLEMSSVTFGVQVTSVNKEKCEPSNFLFPEDWDGES
jgi:hypothetical protein